MNPMLAIINAFLTLRTRMGEKCDPVYARLVHKEKGNLTVGWIWRDNEKSGKPLKTHEIFNMTVRNSIREVTVKVQWMPMFYAEIEGSVSDKDFVLWFLHQNPEVKGGTYISIDSFHNGTASWEEPAWDFFLVRCGKYTNPRSGDSKWRQPSNDAIDWVNDPGRFITSPRTREIVLRAMETPLPSGERLTIRRIFY